MWTALASLLGAGLSFVGGLFANRKNKEIADQNIAYQKEANTQNVEMQKAINEQNIAFQKQENEITRQREDTAVQRAAADMSAAGLSKTLAAGHPASAAALSAPVASAPQVSPVNNSYKYESALQRMNIAQLLQDMAVKGEQLAQSKKLNDAQVDLIRSQAIGQNNINETFREKYENEKLLTFAQIATHEAQTSVYKAEAKLKEIEGDYRGELLQNEVDKGIQQIVMMRTQNRLYGEQITLTQKQVSYYANQMAESIARVNNLNKATELLVADLAKRKLEVEVLQYNLGYSKQHSMRTTDSNMRLMGLDVTALGHGLTDILSGITHGTIFKDIGNFLFK